MTEYLFRSQNDSKFVKREMHHCTCMISIKTINDKINHCKVTEKNSKHSLLWKRKTSFVWKLFLLAIQIERSLWVFFHQIVCVYQAQKTNGEIQEWTIISCIGCLHYFINNLWFNALSIKISKSVVINDFYIFILRGNMTLQCKIICQRFKKKKF